MAQGFTNLWRLYHTVQGNWRIAITKAHEKYGPVVRIGPNVLDVDYPSMLKTIFNVKAEWRKVGHSGFTPSSHHQTANLCVW